MDVITEERKMEGWTDGTDENYIIIYPFGILRMPGVGGGGVGGGGGGGGSKLFKAHIMLKHLIEMINHISISIIILLRKKTCEKVYMLTEKTMDFQYRISFFRSPFMYDFDPVMAIVFLKPNFFHFLCYYYHFSLFLYK